MSDVNDSTARFAALQERLRKVAVALVDLKDRELSGALRDLDNKAQKLAQARGRYVA